MDFDSIGRILIVASFAIAGIYNVIGCTQQIARLKGFNVPFPSFAFWLGMAIQVLGSFLIITRWHSDVGVLCLIVFTVVATLVYHRFWTKEDAGQRVVSRITMVANVAIVGGLLLLLDR